MALCNDDTSCETNCARPAKTPIKPTPLATPGLDINVNTNCSGGGSGCQTCIDGIVADPAADLGIVDYTFDEETGGRTYRIGTKYKEFPDNFARITIKDGLSSFVQWTDNCVHLNFSGGEFEYVTYGGVIGNVEIPATIAPYEKGYYLYIDSVRKRVGRSNDLQAILDNTDYYIYGYMGQDDVDGVSVPAIFIDGYSWYPCPQAETPGCDVCISDIVAGEDSELVTVTYTEDDETGERLYAIDVKNFPDNFARIVVDGGLSKFLTWTDSGSHVNFTGGEFKYHTYGGSSGTLKVPTAVSPFATGWYVYFDKTTGRVGRAEALETVIGREGAYVIGYMGMAEVDNWEDLTPAIYIDGFGWYPFLTEEMQNSHAKIAEIQNFANTAPIRWESNPVLPTQRALYIEAGTYPVFTYDGEFAGDYTISASTYQEFIPGSYVCIDVIQGSGIYIESDFDTIEATPGRYIIAKFNYVAGSQNAYVYGFGNYTDIPATVNAGVANIVGLPSTFSPAWTSATAFQMPAGTYVMRNATTGANYSFSLASPVTLTYSFSCVIYYVVGGSTFLVASTAAVPTNAVVVGAMNTINGVPTITLNGVRHFPYTDQSTAIVRVTSLPTVANAISQGLQGKILLTVAGTAHILNYAQTAFVQLDLGIL